MTVGTGVWTHDSIPNQGGQVGSSMELDLGGSGLTPAQGNQKIK